jgi:hypothetical protein
LGLLTCAECKVELPVSEFYQRRSTQGIIARSQCKTCARKYQHRRRKKDPEKSSFQRAYQGAKRREILFSIPYETFLEFLKMPCFYCGKMWNSKTDYQSVWLDRVDNEKYYEVDNVFPCCQHCNLMRRDHLSVEETRVAATAVRDLRKKIAETSSEGRGGEVPASF